MLLAEIHIQSAGEDSAKNVIHHQRCRIFRRAPRHAQSKGVEYGLRRARPVDNDHLAGRRSGWRRQLGSGHGLRRSPRLKISFGQLTGFCFLHIAGNHQGGAPGSVMLLPEVREIVARDGLDRCGSTDRAVAIRLISIKRLDANPLHRLRGLIGFLHDGGETLLAHAFHFLR